MNPCALGFKFRIAGGAFIQNFIKPVGAAFAFGVVAFFYLPLVFVFFKFLFDFRLDFVCGQPLQILHAKKFVDMRLLADFSIGVLAPLRGIDKISVRFEHNDGHFCVFAKLSERAVEPFVYARKLKSCLGIERHRMFLAFEIV